MQAVAEDGSCLHETKEAAIQCAEKRAWVWRVPFQVVASQDPRMPWRARPNQ